MNEIIILENQIAIMKALAFVRDIPDGKVKKLGEQIKATEMVIKNLK